MVESVASVGAGSAYGEHHSKLSRNRGPSNPESRPRIPCFFGLKTPRLLVRFSIPGFQGFSSHARARVHARELNISLSSYWEIRVLLGFATQI